MNKKKGFVTVYVFYVTVWLFLNASETGSVCFPKIGYSWVISFFSFFSFLTKNVEHLIGPHWDNTNESVKSVDILLAGPCLSGEPSDLQFHIR